MKTKLLLTISAIFLAFFVNQMQAEEPAKWYNKAYVGAGLGYVPGGIDSTNSFGTWPFSPNEVDVNIFAGYEVHKYLDIELQIVHSFKQTQSTGELFDNGEITIDSRYTADYSRTLYNIVAKPKYAIKNHENHVVFAILGLGYYTSSITDDYDTDKYTGINYKVGLGYEYKVNKNHSMVADYTYNYINNVERHDGWGNDVINSYNKLNIAYKYSFK